MAGGWQLQVIIVLKSHQTRAGDRTILIVAPPSAESPSSTAGVEVTSCLVQILSHVTNNDDSRTNTYCSGSSFLHGVRIVWVMRASRSLNAEPGADVSSVNLHIP